MTGNNRTRVNVAFDIISKGLKSVVPPCVLSADTATHCEVVAQKGDVRHVLAYVVAHEHEVTLGFATELSREVMHVQIPETLLVRMNKHHRIEIEQLQGEELRKDIQQAIANLMNYYTQLGWIAV